MAIWDRLTGGIIGLGIGGAIGRAVRPIFELVEQESWDDNPNRVLGLQQLAELVANAVVDFNPAAAEAQRSGYEANRLRALVELALRAPTIGQAMDMRRRDVITADQFRHALRKAGLEPQYDAAAFELLNVLPSVTDLVHMAVREVFNPALRAELDLDAEFPAAFAERAEKIGLSRDLAEDYWADHWQLPSYEQLAEMLFRTDLDPAGFSNALKALDYAPTWRERLETIARRIPTVPDMVRFAVREVYPGQGGQALGIFEEFPDRFAEEAALHGLSREHAEQYWAAHWRLPSARQGYQMVWRDVIEPAQLRGLLKALDYPPQWRDRLFEIAFIVPGRIDLKRMLRHEILDRDEVKEGYRQIGYNELNAERMTQIAEAEVGTGAAGETYVGKARTSLWNRIHAEAVARQLTEAELDDGLAAVGVPAAERGRVKTLWAFESILFRRELTVAEIVKAWKKGQYDDAEALFELQERGMSEGDAQKKLASA